MARAALRRLRKEKGLTRGDLAKALGVNENTVYLWESGRRNLNLQWIDRLCQAFGLEPSYFFGGSERREDEQPPRDEEWGALVEVHRLLAEAHQHLSRALDAAFASERAAQELTERLIAARQSSPQERPAARGARLPGPGTIRPADRPGVEGAAVPPAPRPAMR